MNAMRRLHRTDRGATLAEYALLVGLIAVVSLGALTFLGDSAEAKFERAGGALSGDADHGAAATPPGPAAPSGGSPSPTVPSGGSPADDESTGGDSSGGDPTGGDPTGGDPTGGESTGGESTGGESSSGATTSGSTWGASSATLQNKNKWRAEASVTVHGADGRPFTAASAGVQVRVVQVYRDWQGNLGERSWTDQANLTNGVATFESGNLNTGANGQEEVVAMRYEVTGVVYYWPQDPPVRWDGTMPSITVDAPTP